MKNHKLNVFHVDFGRLSQTIISFQIQIQLIYCISFKDDIPPGDMLRFAEIP